MRPSSFASRFCHCALAVSLLSGVSGAAQAGVIGTFTSAGFSYPNNGPDAYTGPSSVYVTLQPTTQFGSSDSAYLSQGGAFVWNGTYTPNGGSPTLINGLLSYCVEINQNIYPGWPYHSYQVTTDIAAAPVNGPGTSPMGNLAAGYIADLWSKYITLAKSDKADSGAFQLAIWKLEYDTGNAGLTGSGAPIETTASGQITGIDWFSGNLRAAPWSDLGELNKAAGFLTGLVSDESAANLRALISDQFQDQIFEVPGPNSLFAVPEPASAVTWLLISLVGGCGSMSRRRQKATA